MDNHPGEVASFEVLLSAMEMAPSEGNVMSVPLPGGRDRILLVDDEPLLADATKQMLVRLGYKVECCMVGIGALEALVLQPKEEPFDLVITDLTMPQLTETELAHLIRKVLDE